MSPPTEKAIELLKKHNACIASIAFVQSQTSPIVAWNTCKNRSWYAWLLAALNYPRHKFFVSVCKEMIRILDSPLSDSAIPIAKDRKIARTRLSIYLKQAEDTGKLPVIPENMGQCWFLPFHRDMADVVKGVVHQSYYFEHYLIHLLLLFRTACGLSNDEGEVVRSVVTAKDVFDLADIPCQ